MLQLSTTTAFFLGASVFSCALAISLGERLYMEYANYFQPQFEASENSWIIQVDKICLLKHFFSVKTEDPSKFVSTCQTYK